MAERGAALNDVETAERIAQYRAESGSPSRGGFIKWLNARGETAGWRRVVALWGEDPEATKRSAAAVKAAATKAAAHSAVVAVASEVPVANPVTPIIPTAAVSVPAPVAAVAAATGVVVSEKEARAALVALEKDLCAKFPERREVIEGCIAALIASEHVLLLGPPGTAKSALVLALSGALGLSSFEYLLGAYTDPSEIVGAVDVPALKEGVRRVVTTGKLPEAEVAFLDEIFKAGSALLNTLLAIVNERKFHNGNGAMRCPLISLFAASNEGPQDESLAALYDRLFLRYEVEYVKSDENMMKIFAGGLPKATISVSKDALLAAQAGAAAVSVPEATQRAILDIRSKLKAEGIIASDRRWVKSLAMVRAFAWLDGESEAAPEHLAFMTDALWTDPEQKATVRRIVSAATNSIAAKAAEIVEAAKECIAAVERYATYDRGMVLNEAPKANAKLDEMIAKLREIEASATKRQRPAAEKARQDVEAIKARLIEVVKKGSAKK